MSWGAAKVAIDLVSLVCASAAWVFTWVVARRRASRDKLEELQLRVIRMESELHTLPGKEELAVLHEKINPLREDMHAMKATMESMRHSLSGLDASVRMFTEYLLKERKG